MDLASPSFYMWHDVTYKHAVILILKIHLLGLLTSIILLDTWGGVYIKQKYYYLKKLYTLIFDNFYSISEWSILSY